MSPSIVVIDARLARFFAGPGRIGPCVFIDAVPHDAIQPVRVRGVETVSIIPPIAMGGHGGSRRFSP